MTDGNAPNQSVTPHADMPNAPAAPHSRVAKFFSDARVQNALISLLLVASTLAVYVSVRQHDFVNLDDDVYVYDNLRVQKGLTSENVRWAFTTTSVANWHPLAWLSHQLDCQLFGVNPAGHHLTNLILHAINVLLLFFVLLKLSGARWRSALVAALFALHPLNIETVAWVAERKSLLCMAFSLLATLFYAAYARRPQLKTYLAVFLSFALALMSKPMAVTLPCLLLLLDFYPLNRFQLKEGEPLFDRANLRRAAHLLFEKLPLFALVAASCALTYIAQRSSGAMALGEKLPFRFRAANAALSYFKYILMTFWATNLAVFYPHLGVHTPEGFAALAALALAAVTALIFWRANRRREEGYLLTGWLWFLGALVPVIGFVQVGNQAMADRYAYLPHIGLFLIVAWGGYDIARRIKLNSRIVAVCAACLLFAFAVNTRQQLNHWYNSLTLFTHTLKAAGDSGTAHNNLGSAYAKLGMINEAADEFRKAIEFAPDRPEQRYNLAFALTGLGRTDEAVRIYCDALNLSPTHELSAKIFNNVGLLMFNKGDRAEALKNYREALAEDPNNVEVHINLGHYYYTEKNYDEAVAEFSRALAIKPLPGTYFRLGLAQRDQGKLQEAAESFRAAVKLAPDFDEARQALSSTLEALKTAANVSGNGANATSRRAS